MTRRFEVGSWKSELEAGSKILDGRMGGHRGNYISLRRGIKKLENSCFSDVWTIFKTGCAVKRTAELEEKISENSTT